MLTDEEADAIIAEQDRLWELRETMQDAHQLTATTRAAMTDDEQRDDDYRTTFGAALSETRTRRAARQRRLDYKQWFRETCCNNGGTT